MKMKKMQKKIKNQKNSWVKAAILATVLLSLIACSKAKDHVAVRIPVNNPGAIDFKAKDKIFFLDLSLQNLPEKLDPKPLMHTFFLDELPKEIGKDIEVLELEEDGGKSRENLGELLKVHQKSLLITGNLKVDIKKRSIIRKVKTEGKKIKQFVPVQLWEMVLTMTITDSDSGEKIFEEEFKSQLKEADPDKQAFNFKSLFNTLCERFIKKIKKTKRFEERFLLLK